MELESLVACLEAVPPLSLEGVALQMQRHPPTRAQLVAATRELVAYTQACHQCWPQLSCLTSVPLHQPCLEFGP